MKHFLFYTLLGTLLTVLPASFSYTALTDELVGYWTFDEGTGKKVKDQSKNGHDADIIANAKWVEGQFGKAIEITAPGADCVNVPPAETLKIKGEITMMAWVYQNSWGASAAQWFDKNCHNGGEKNSYGIGVFGNNILMMLGETGSRKDHSVPNEMKDKKWHHIVGTYDGKAKKIYLDGKMLAEGADKFNFAGTNDSDLRIGCAKDRPQYTFDGGMIDEAAIWRRALSLDEIKQAMNGNILAVSPRGQLPATWGSIKQRGMSD